MQLIQILSAGCFAIGVMAAPVLVDTAPLNQREADSLCASPNCGYNETAPAIVERMPEPEPIPVPEAEAEHELVVKCARGTAGSGVVPCGYSKAGTPKREPEPEPAPVPEAMPEAEAEAEAELVAKCARGTASGSDVVPCGYSSTDGNDKREAEPEAAPEPVPEPAVNCARASTASPTPKSGSGAVPCGY